MNKSELIDAVADMANSTRNQVEAVINALQETIVNVVQQGDKLVLPGFITVSVSERAERKGRNPATGEEITIEAGKVVKIKAGNKLKEAVKSDA
jgi:DNA-binding protein HU-beta